MLTGKQKRYLRSKAHHEKSTFQIGKFGVNENMLKQLDDILNKRELIKVSVLQNSELDKDEAAHIISSELSAEIVQVMGNTIVFFRESKENPIYELPN